MLYNDEETKLSIEEVRAFEGYENISKEDAIKLIDGLYRISKLSYYIITNN